MKGIQSNCDTCVCVCVCVCVGGGGQVEVQIGRCEGGCWLWLSPVYVCVGGRG